MAPDQVAAEVGGIWRLSLSILHRHKSQPDEGSNAGLMRPLQYQQGISRKSQVGWASHAPLRVVCHLCGDFGENTHRFGARSPIVPKEISKIQPKQAFSVVLVPV
jgi:hypothetical protein